MERSSQAVLQYPQYYRNTKHTLPPWYEPCFPGIVPWGLTACYISRGLLRRQSVLLVNTPDETLQEHTVRDRAFSQLTAYKRIPLDLKVKKIGDIRNALGHSHALWTWY